MRHRRLFARDCPKSFKENAGLARQALNLRYLGEIRKRISADGRTHNSAVERERGADDRQSVNLRYNNGGPLLGLSDTAVSAFGKNAGVIPCLVEQLEEWRRMDGAENGALVGVEQPDAKLRGAAIFLQRRLPQVGAEEPVTGAICHAVFFHCHRR